MRVKGGKGGDGCVSLASVYLVEFAGPDGGDGGNGGHVLFKVFYFLNLVYLEAFTEESVNSQNYWGENHTLYNLSSTSVVFGVNSLFLGGLHLF